jgi:hypothetical protein
MLLIQSFVAPSSIEGVGVFAAEAIPAGALIWKLDSGFDRLIPEDEIARLPATFKAFVERYGYPYPHDQSVVVVELDNGRFMNHAIEPNTCFTDPDAGYALRRIEAGEEITCNYSEFDPAFEILPGRRFAGEGPRRGAERQPGL